MNLVLAQMYNIDFEDWDIDCINKVAKTYSKVSRDIALRLQYLQDKKSEEIQQF